MDIHEEGWEGIDCVDVSQERDMWRALMYAVMNFRVP